MSKVRPLDRHVYLDWVTDLEHAEHAGSFALLPAAMKPSTDYIRHAARLARKLQMDSAMGTPTAPDAEFYKVLAKALEEVAAGLEQVATRE